MPKILIADDQTDVLAALRLLLKGERFDIETATSPAGVLEKVNSQDLDVVLIDLNYARDTTSGDEGLDLLTSIRAVDPSLPVVVMTAWGNVDLAVEAMRRGARDFIQKPWDNARLLAVVRTQVELGMLRRGRRLEAENMACGQRAEDSLKQYRIVGESHSMKSVLKLVERMAQRRNVLIRARMVRGGSRAHECMLLRRAGQPLISSTRRARGRCFRKRAVWTCSGRVY